MALLLDERRNLLGIAPRGGGECQAETTEGTEKRDGGDPKHVCGVCRCGCPPARHTLRGPGSRHGLDVSWGENVVLRPVFQLPGNT